MSAAEFTRAEPLHIAEDFTFPVDTFAIPPQYKGYIGSVMIPHGMVVDRIERLAQDIRKAYPDSTPHFLVVLKGGAEFATDLTRALRSTHANGSASHIPYTLDYVRVKSYEGTESSGNVKISGIDLKTVKDRDIIFLEDIIDTGLTMSKLIPLMKEAGAKSVRVASLLEKRTERSCGYKADFVGFSVPDHFVIGYCLDYNEAFRELSHICIINKAGIEAFKEHPATKGLL